MARRLQRDGGLDAIRGIAALVVVNYHASLAFLPHRMTIFLGTPANPHGELWTHFWFALFDGPAAVTLFFVLSGFVLTRGCFLTGRSDMLLRTAIKRYPRLAGPVLAVCLLAWALFRLGLHDNARAALLTGSTWLTAFGADPGPSLADALKQGLWRTLVHGNVNYNTSLWTMRIELIGSFVSLAAAAVLARLLAVSGLLAVLVGFAGYLTFRGSPLFVSAFLAGVTLSAALSGRRLPRLPLWLGLAMCAVGLYFFGFTQTTGDYAWLSRVPPNWIAQAALPVSCSVVVIFAVESCPGLRAGLSSPLFLWLGRISFALYLVHYLVIVSAGSFVRVHLNGLGPQLATLVAFVTVYAVSLALATPLSWYDAWLMERLDRIVGRIVPRAKVAARSLRTEPAPSVTP